MTRYLKLEWRNNSIFSHTTLMVRDRAMNAQINRVVGSMVAKVLNDDSEDPLCACFCFLGFGAREWRGSKERYVSLESLESLGSGLAAGESSPISHRCPYRQHLSLPSQEPSRYLGMKQELGTTLNSTLPPSIVLQLQYAQLLCNRGSPRGYPSGDSSPPNLGSHQTEHISTQCLCSTRLHEDQMQ